MPLLEPIQGGEAKAAPSNINLIPSEISATLGDAPERGRKPQENGIKESSLIAYISQRFTRSTMYRRPYEQLWLTNHRNYRGLYGPDSAFTSTEKSKLFIRITKTKVVAAYGQLTDVLFANNQFPIQVEPERLPEGVIDVESIETNPSMADKYSKGQQQGQEQELKYGYPGDGTRPEETSSNIAEQAFVGGLRQTESVQEGYPQSPSAVAVEPAMLSAKKMQKKIQDQLRASDGDKHLRHVALECALMGTGIAKGPIAVHDIVTEVDENGNEVPKPILKPKVEAVSIWNMYFDPDARCVDDCDYIIQRHKLSMSQLRTLKMRPGFRANEIDALIGGGYNYLRQWWEPFLQDMPMVQPVEKYEVLEYWGMVDKALLSEFGIAIEDIPVELQEADEIPCNVWVSGKHVIRLIINPFNNGRWPYYVIPYEIQPYTIYGIGVAESLADTQMLMNGFMRLAVDNSVISGNMVFEIDEASLVPGQDFSLYPGKFFRKMGGVQGQAIYAHQFPNTAQANMMLYDKARSLADESTFPSISHGNTTVNPSLGRTSSGLSMVMGASSVGIRSAVANFDDYLLTPLGAAMFEFNKLNDEDPELKGNFVISGGGVSALMRNEVKSQKLLSILQLSEQPALSAFFKIPAIIRELCTTLDMDADKFTNTEQEAQRFALLLQTLQAMQAPPAMQGQPQQAPTGRHGGTAPNPGEEPMQSEPAGSGGPTMPNQKGFTANKSPNTARTKSGVS